MTNHSGLCLGGPCDGQIISYHKSYMRVAEGKPPINYVTHIAVDAAVAVTTYALVTTTFGSYWLPNGTPDTHDDVMALLVEGYRSGAAAKKQLTNRQLTSTPFAL